MSPPGGLQGPVAGRVGAGRPAAIVLAAGDIPVPALLPPLLEGVQLVVAADGGLRHAAPLGLMPSLIVGDLDSVEPALLAKYDRVSVEEHRADKDELDLELAMIAARELGAGPIRVLGAFGGRLDHTLAALLVGARWAEEGHRVSLHGGSHEAWFCTPRLPLELTLARGTIVSLLALRGPATLTSEGLRFVLQSTTLEFGVGLGMSNAVSGDRVLVRSESGVAALVVEHEA